LLVLEIDINKNNDEKASSGSHESNLINVRVIISCPTGDYKKKFRNQFPREQMDLFLVSARVFDWMTCPRCGELLNCNFEFSI
jgi:hypothetical protein